MRLIIGTLNDDYVDGFTDVISLKNQTFVFIQVLDYWGRIGSNLEIDSLVEQSFVDILDEQDMNDISTFVVNLS